MALWASFSLVYGTEVVLPLEITVPSARMALQSEMLHDVRTSELEALDERRDLAHTNLRAYQQRIARAYDALVNQRQFAEGDLVLKATLHVMRGVSTSKFIAKWEGPFLVKGANANGYYCISNPTLKPPWRQPTRGG